jgi:hypothetical protein
MKIQLPVTSIASVLTLAIICAALVGDIDLVKLNVEFFQRIEPHEIDDVVVSSGLMIVGLVIDRVVASRREKKDAEIRTQRLRVLKATMRTVQDIVNNFLNNLLLFRIEGEQAFSPESLEQFDDLVQGTSAKLKALGDLEAITEIQTGGGVAIGYATAADGSHDATGLPS